MFKTKICGITNPTMAQVCCDSGAGAIGLNFFAKSKRFVDVERALKIAEVTSNPTLKVGLFVNQSAAEVQSTARSLGLDCIQLHGNEEPKFLNDLKLDQLETVFIIRAIRISKDNEPQALREIEEWSESNYSDRIGALLLDANVPKSFGGTGQTIDWNWLSQVDLPTDKPLILAGGLTPDNVETAIEMIRPFGVDVAGGVEDSDGRKNPVQIDRFIRQANLAFAKYDHLSG